MKKTKINWVLGLGIFAVSCAPIYKCGETPPENGFNGSRRVEAVVQERDSLCRTLSAEEQRNETLTQLLDLTQDSLLALQQQYDILKEQSMKTSDQLSAELQQKSEELAKKAELLSQREKALREMQSIIARQDSITNRLQQTLRNALLAFDSDELSVEIKNGKVYVSLSDKLLFASGSAAVQPKGKEALEALATVLKKNPDISILVEGHTDNVPIKTAKYADNWDLSVARATTIVRILAQDYDIQPTRMTAAGRGEYFPKASNDTEAGRAKNRRTEIILSPKLEELMEVLQK